MPSSSRMNSAIGPGTPVQSSTRAGRPSSATIVVGSPSSVAQRSGTGGVLAVRGPVATGVTVSSGS